MTLVETDVLSWYTIDNQSSISQDLEAPRAAELSLIGQIAVLVEEPFPDRYGVVILNNTTLKADLGAEYHHLVLGRSDDLRFGCYENNKQHYMRNKQWGEAIKKERSRETGEKEKGCIYLNRSHLQYNLNKNPAFASLTYRDQNQNQDRIIWNRMWCLCRINKGNMCDVF